MHAPENCNHVPQNEMNYLQLKENEKKNYNTKHHLICILLQIVTLSPKIK